MCYICLSALSNGTGRHCLATLAPAPVAQGSPPSGKISAKHTFCNFLPQAPTPCTTRAGTGVAKQRRPAPVLSTLVFEILAHRRRHQLAPAPTGAGRHQLAPAGTSWRRLAPVGAGWHQLAPTAAGRLSKKTEVLTSASNTLLKLS